VAIALDGKLPESSPDGLPGQAYDVTLAGARSRKLATAAKLAGDCHSVNGVPGDDEITLRAAAEESASATDLESHLVKKSFEHLMSEGPVAMEYFYARLFAADPDIRTLFPMTMTAQRERTFAALCRLVWSLDDEPGCAEMLDRLGRDHRRFGVTERHYSTFFATLTDTVRHFIGSDWTPDTAAAWQGMLDYVSASMRAAAERDAQTSPRWWTAEIISHELRSPGVAVVRLRPSQPLPYQAGQYIPVQVTRWPRVWRRYSIANAPRRDSLIELHVRAVPGGLVSNTLVYHSDIGDSVLLGAAEGTMTLTESDRDLLCVAGGTGLAPIKAIIEQAIATPLAGPARKMTLFLGARQHFDLYDLDDLQLLESACPSLRVIPVLSEEPGYNGLTGRLPDVIRGHGLFENAEAYVCGPAVMVSRTAALLAASIPASQLHHDPLI